ncbi:hypothetical protein GPY57_25465 [Photorhabdus laumondii subsp. laumondii]|nr:hypothetical protein [Photorhabdus laumondii subsp. laumondii]
MFWCRKTAERDFSLVQRLIRVVVAEERQRPEENRICLAAIARWSHLTPCRTQQ